MQNNLAVAPAAPVNTLNYSFQSDALELTYCCEHQILQMYWGKNLNRQNMEAGYKVVFEYIKVFKPSKYLLDLHLREQITAENQTWFFKNIIPEMLRLTGSTTFLAAIVPVNFYTTLTEEIITNILPDDEQLLVIDHFLLPDMGLTWLKSLA